MKTLAELFEEEEANLAGVPDDTPEQIAARIAKSRAEWERGIALGWHDKDGNPGPNADPDEDDEGED